MSADHNHMSHHDSMQDELPKAIRFPLLEEAKQDWRGHPWFADDARFTMNAAGWRELALTQALRDETTQHPAMMSSPFFTTPPHSRKTCTVISPTRKT